MADGGSPPRRNAVFLDKKPFGDPNMPEPVELRRMAEKLESSPPRRNAMIPEKKPMGDQTMTRRGGLASAANVNFEDLRNLQGDLMAGDPASAGGAQAIPEDAQSDATFYSQHSGAQMRLEDQLTNEKLRELQLIFEEADEDGGGGLDMDEFRNAMRKAMGGQLTDNELDQLFMKVDTNCDGTVDWDEYLSYMLLEYREKDQMNIESQKKPFPKDSQKVSNIWLYQRHSDALLRIALAPSVVKLNSVLFRPTSDGNSRYVTVTKDGIINFWTNDLKHKSYHKVDRLRPHPSQQMVGVWVTDLVFMSNLNMIAVSTTAADVVFYTTMHNKITPARCIVDLEICVTCMDYWVNPAKPAHSVLYMGDARGNVYGITYNTCDTACFFHPTLNANTSFNVSISDVLAGKHCCATGVMLPGIHEDFVLKIKYVHELQTFISCCRDRSTAVFSGDLRQLKKTYYKVRKGIFDFSYSKKNNVIVTGGKDGIVRVWNPYVCAKPVILLHGHKSAVLHVIVNEKEEHVISISEDQDINVFDMATQVCVQTIHRQHINIGSRPISASFFNVARQSLILGTNELAFLEHEEGEVLFHNLKSHISPANVIIYNPLFDQLISGSADSLVCVWDIKSGERLMQFYAHKTIYLGQEVAEDITAMKLDPTKRRLATAARDGAVRIWNFNNGALLRELPVFDKHEICSIVWERGRIITAGWNRRLTVYVDDVEDDTVTQFKCRHYEDILALAFVHPATVISASFDGDIICWSMDTGRLLYRFNERTGDRTVVDPEHSESVIGKRRYTLRLPVIPSIQVDGKELRNDTVNVVKQKSRRGSTSPRRVSMQMGSGSGRRLSVSPRRRSISPTRQSVSTRRESVSTGRQSVASRRQSVTSRRQSVSGRRQSILVESKEESTHRLSNRKPFSRAETNETIHEIETGGVIKDNDAENDRDHLKNTPLTPEQRIECLKILARLVRKRQARRKARDPGMDLYRDARDTSVEKLLVLDTRSMGRQTACLVATGAEGWVRFWSIHPDSGLLGEYSAVHRDGDAILTMATDASNHYLITGDTRGYIKVWFIEMYCIDSAESSSSDTWIPRRPDGIPSYHEQDFPFLGVTEKAQKMHCPNTGFHQSRQKNSKLFGAPPLLNSFRGHLQSVSCVEYIDSKEYIISCSVDCSIRLWTLSGEFLGIFGQDVPWEAPQPEPSTTSLSSGSSSASSIIVQQSSRHLGNRFSKLKAPNSDRKLPADVRKVASSTTMRVLYGGLRPHWRLAKNIVLIWIPMLRNTRRPLEFSDLMGKDNEAKELEKYRLAPDEGQGDKTAILGKAYKSGRKHQALPKLSDIRCFQSQVDVFSSLPCHDLTTLDIRCSTPQIIREARESQKAMERYKKTHNNMNRAKNRLMKLQRVARIPLAKRQSVTFQSVKGKKSSLSPLTVPEASLATTDKSIPSKAADDVV